jgi:hypothetical protein
MKRIAIILCISFTCAGLGWAAYRVATPSTSPLSKFVPAGPLLYLEAQDVSSLLSDWNSSAQKKQWIESSNYEVFSRSRLFLRLKGASDQFAAAAGLPPNMNFLAQVSGRHSVLALYDIGNLQFLYITYLPSAKSMETTLWQTRAKFETRNAGGADFYVRRDPESQREVAFAVSGDYLLLATREDILAGALQLMAGKQDRTVESEPWWLQTTSATGSAGDLRLVLDLGKLVPNGYFRTYWVQQNITDLSQYSAAVTDLFRSGTQYREERVLIRKKEPEQTASAEGEAAAAEVTRLVPDNAGVYVAIANPSADSAFALLENKLLAPHLGPAPVSQLAPQVQLTSGEQGGGSDLETRIDQAPAQHPAGQQSSALKELLEKTPILASLQVQSTERDNAGVFVRIRSSVVLVGATDWGETAVQSALADFVRPGLTAGQFGVGWQPRTGYEEFDGVWPLAVAVRGKYLVLSDSSTLMESLLANFSRKSDRKAGDLLAGFNHDQERENFGRLSGLIDRPNGIETNAQGGEHEPQFFSGNMASLSKTLAGVSAERIELRSDGGKVHQTVTYEWSR